MGSSATVNFNYEGFGKVSIPIERCREICPDEMAALEAASSAVGAAQEAGDMTAMTRYLEEVARLMEALHQCMLAEARKRFDSTLPVS